MSNHADTPGTSGAPGVTPFPRLFSPLRLRPLEIRNRIVSSGHDTVMGEHGLIGDRLIAYQQARAAGGVGLIVVQVASVHESAEYTSHALSAMNDACNALVTRTRERALTGHHLRRPSTVEDVVGPRLAPLMRARGYATGAG